MGGERDREGLPERVSSPTLIGNGHASNCTARHGDLAWNTRGLEGMRDDEGWARCGPETISNDGVAFFQSCWPGTGYSYNQPCDTAVSAFSGGGLSINLIKSIGNLKRRVCELIGVLIGLVGRALGSS